MPCLGSTLLECLSLKVLPLLLLLLCVLHRFVLLGRGAPFLALGVILLHRKLQGLDIDHPLAKQTRVLGESELKAEGKWQ